MTLRLATVTATHPLRVRVDGAASDSAAVTLGYAPTLGDRVAVDEAGRLLLVLAGPASAGEHTHDDLAAAAHTHDYAATSHSHPYAPANHTHDTSHVHGVYGIERVRSGSSQYLSASTWTNLTFTATTRTHGTWATSSSYTRPGRSGWYAVSLRLDLSGEANGARFLCRLYNSTRGDYPMRNENYPASASPSFVYSSVEQFDANQTVYVQPYSTIACYVTNATMTMAYLGPGE